MNQIESKFKKQFLNKVNDMLGEEVVYPPINPSNYQGFPDTLLLYKGKWAALEFKRNKNSKRQPNQEHYVKTMNERGFARFVYPENEEEVLNDIQQLFSPKR